MIQAIENWSGAARLKTRHLALLLNLYEQRSVLRGAEAANMTQPAASKLLAEMEAMLGVPLFTRHARGIEPTWYGQVLARRARSALSEIGRAHDEIAALREGRMGEASVGTVVNPGTTLVPQAIAAVKREFPDLLVRLEMDYSKPLVERLLDGQLDLVVGRIMDPERADDLDFELLADEPHSIVVRSGHPLARKRRLGYEDLAGHGWIMPPAGSVLRSRLDTVLLEQGVPGTRNIVETSSLPLIIHLLRHSDLLTALPPESVAPYLQTRQMVVLPIRFDLRMDYFGIIRRRGHALSPGAERVLEALQTTARRLYPPQDLNGSPGNSYIKTSI